MAEWSRVVNTTTRRYLKEVENNLLRNRKLFALLKSKGRFTFNWSGTEMDWKIEYKRNQLQGYADGDILIFDRKERWKTAVLGWRGYSMTDAMSKMERLINSGQEAIVKVYSTIATNLAKDVQELFGEELYLNGSLPANAKRLHGIESFMGYDGALFSQSAYVLPASQTYAGNSTKLGAYGGNWTGTWPAGRGDTHYDFYTPLIVNYKSTSFTASANNDWAHSAHKALRYLIQKTKKSKSAEGQLDVIFVDDEMYRSWLDNFLDAKERIYVSRNEKVGLVALGFTDVNNIDGTDVTWEYGMPPDVGYGFNCNEMEVRSLQDQLFVPDGPDYSIDTKTWRFSIDFLGNAVFNPKFFGKLIGATS